MEPMHIHALLVLSKAEEARRIRLEQDLVARDHTRSMQRERIRRWKSRFAGRNTPAPTVEFAV